MAKNKKQNENLIILTDERGKRIRFEHLDTVEYEGEEYVVLYPADAGDDEPVHILRISAEDIDTNEMEYEGLDDDDLIQAVYEVFLERWEEE